MDIVVNSLMLFGMLVAPLYALLGMRTGDDSRAAQYYRVSAVGAVLAFGTIEMIKEKPMNQLATQTEACAHGACNWAGWPAVIEQWSRVKFGQVRTCTVCDWREYDDWCAARAGSVRFGRQDATTGRTGRVKIVRRHAKHGSTYAALDAAVALKGRHRAGLARNKPYEYGP